MSKLFLPQYWPPRLRGVYEGKDGAVRFAEDSVREATSVSTSERFEAYVAATSATKCTHSGCSYSSLACPPDMPAQHRRHNHSVVAGGNRSAAENANRPATADVITRRGLGTTLDSHRTLELGSHFRHSMSAIIGHCPRTAVAERTAACM